jgi:uncharacterized protein YecE (DUF72 family)
VTRKRGKLHIGTSGYQYDHWTGVLYPGGLKKKDRFACYAEHFDTVEINNTFYNLPKPETFDDWKDAAPEGFTYALKFSRYGSHIKRLKDPEEPIERFLEGADRLGATLGPILVQLPPHWHCNLERLQGFLEAAPGTYRWVIEVRDPSWLGDEVYEALSKHDVALCVHDMLPDHPRVPTASFVYLRFHGTGEGYSGSYTPQFLTAEAKRIEADLGSGRDVYAYFNNDTEGHAVRNAAQLRRYVEG